MERFFLRLQVRVIWLVKDEMVWVGTKEGIFSVKQLYTELEPERLVNFPTKVIWKSCTPPKVGFFAWEASWSRILTMNIVQKRGRVMAN